MYVLNDAWIDFYNDPLSPASRLFAAKYTNQQNVTVGSLHVYSCFFDNCSASSGAAILVSASTKLLVEETTFSSCQASEQGSALYFYNSGSCILSKVCGYKCKSNGDGQFSYVSLSNVLDDNNSMIDCSISGIDNPSYYYGIYLCYGSIKIYSTNSSNNICYDKTSLFLIPVSSSDPSCCSVSFSCFANNIAKGCILIQFESGNAYEMKSCNVVKNSQSSNSWGVIYSYKNLNIYDSCVVENDATYSLYANGGSINVYNCTFDKLTQGSVVIKSGAERTFVNQLFFIKTANCEAENPKIFPRKKKNTCMICRRRSTTMRVFVSSLLIMLS